MNTEITLYSSYNIERIDQSITNLWLKSVQEFIVSLPSKSSQRSMFRYLKIISHAFGFNTVEDFDVAYFKENMLRGIIAKLSQGYAPATVKTCLAAIKGVAKRLKINKVLSADEYELIKDIKCPRGSRVPKGRSLSDQEQDLLFSNLEKEDTPKSMRDCALLSVLVQCGLRRSESVSLRFEDLHLNEDVPYFKVTGKGNKERICFIPKKTIDRLNVWIDYRGSKEGPLFLRLNKYGDVVEDALSDQAVYKIVKERAEEYGMKDWGPHDLRRTFATTLLEKNVDLSTVKDMMGHANISTTQRYDKRGISKMKKAVSVLNGI